MRQSEGTRGWKAGDHLKSPSYLRESPPPDLVSQSRSYFLVHIIGTIWLTRASWTVSRVREGS